MYGIFFDTETNGLDLFKHQIIEIAFSVLNLFSGKELVHYKSLVNISREAWQESNPTSLVFTGISYEELENQGKKKEIVAQEILTLFDKYKLNRATSVFICQNPTFDRNFFARLIPIDTQEAHAFPYIWLDLASMYFALVLSPKLSSLKKLELSKDKIAEHYHLAPEDKPHRAFQGVQHLITCYEKVIGFKD